MIYKVSIQASGREFEAQQGESLLEAALRHGINVTYNCSNGGCGDCRARLLQGQVRSLQHSDYVFSAREKAENYILLCASSAASDLVLDANEVGSYQEIPEQRIKVKVSKIERGGENNLILHLRTPRSKTLRFLAGQYVKLGAANTESMNSYLASCPCNGMNLQVHLHRQSPDAFTRYAFDGLKTGASLELLGPYGNFTLDDDSDRPIVMIAQDSGFAPIKSLVEHAIALDLSQNMELFWMVQHGNAHYQANYCRAWEDALDNFKYRPLHIDNLDDGSLNFEQAQAYVMAKINDVRNCDVYLAGPADFIVSFSMAFAACGVPAAQIRVTHPAEDKV